MRARTVPSLLVRFDAGIRDDAMAIVDRALRWSVSADHFYSSVRMAATRREIFSSSAARKCPYTPFCRDRLNEGGGARQTSGIAIYPTRRFRRFFV